jgi:hypothetical protein
MKGFLRAMGIKATANPIEAQIAFHLPPMPKLVSHTNSGGVVIGGPCKSSGVISVSSEPPVPDTSKGCDGN